MFSHGVLSGPQIEVWVKFKPLVSNRQSQDTPTANSPPLTDFGNVCRNLEPFISSWSKHLRQELALNTLSKTKVIKKKKKQRGGFCVGVSCGKHLNYHPCPAKSKPLETNTVRVTPSLKRCYFSHIQLTSSRTTGCFWVKHKTFLLLLSQGPLICR